MINRWIQFFKHDIWQISLDNTKPFRTFLLKTFHIIVAAAKGFSQDDCTYKAAALSFYTLLALVPVLAIAFGIAKGFGFENILEEEILQTLSQQREVATQILIFARSLLEHVKGGIIAGLGFIFILWTGISLLGNLEEALNEIWQVKSPRSLGRKFSDYLAMIILCPIFLVASGSITVYLSHELTLVTRTYVDTLSPVLSFFFHLFPLFISWILFGFIYFIMPNTQVSFKAGAIAGIIAGTAFQIVQSVFISFQLAISSYGAVYGSFAALPLFLLWLQASWLITFAGAEIAHNIQNIRFDTLYLSETAAGAIFVPEKQIMVWIVSRIVKNFREGKSVSLGELTHELGITINLSRQLVRQLEQAGLITQVYKEGGEDESYLPGRDIKDINFKFVLDSLEKSLESKLLVNPLEDLLEIGNALQAYEKEAQQLPSNQMLA